MKKEAKKCIKYYIDNIQSEKYRVYLSAKKKEGFKNHEEYVKKYKPEWIKRTDFYEPDFISEITFFDVLDNQGTIKLLRKLYSLSERKYKWITWTSLRDCLQNLAELSPEAFLKEAERGIINNPTEIVNLFPPKSGELSGINYISNLLWALEILAWSPEYLVHSISVSTS